ncbi:MULTISPECIES: hypothetical protein [unclassified Methylobacterium]|jgi:hypothetical protein|uniref:hypothetical protein n=1 Tax=unclassified Methylobacterium TaxID=2615210 RepID=UPI001355BEFD|nr:hypothetical protein [Methylobacterium sp. 2A]MWV24671.1 hypothetical protein [Methylobacterium sp. 2A]
MRATDGESARPAGDAGLASVACPVLAVWRRCDPGEIAPGTVVEIERAVAGSGLLLHHRRWPDALRGDPAAVVAAAIDVIHGHPPGTPATDLVMSGLLVHAVRGDATAALVLAHGLAALAHRHPRSGELLERAERWARRWPRRLR